MDEIDYISTIITGYLKQDSSNVLFWGTKENCYYLSQVLKPLTQEMVDGRLTFYNGNKLWLDYSPQVLKTAWNYAGCQYSLIVFENNVGDIIETPKQEQDFFNWSEAMDKSNQCERYMRTRCKSNSKFKSMFITY